MGHVTARLGTETQAGPHAAARAEPGGGPRRSPVGSESGEWRTLPRKEVDHGGRAVRGGAEQAAGRGPRVPASPRPSRRPSSSGAALPALPAAAAAPQDAERSGPEPGDKPVPIGDAPSRDRNAPPAPISNSGTTESGAAGPTPGPGSPPTPSRALTPAVPPGPAARAWLGPAWSSGGL